MFRVVAKHLQQPAPRSCILFRASAFDAKHIELPLSKRTTHDRKESTRIRAMAGESHRLSMPAQEPLGQTIIGTGSNGSSSNLFSIGVPHVPMPLYRNDVVRRSLIWGKPDLHYHAYPVIVSVLLALL